MPDYDLGTAKGEVVIGADTSGADRAAASMAGLNAEARTLQGVMGDSERSMADNEKQTTRTAASYELLREKQEGLRQRLQESREANDQYAASQRELNRVLLDVESTSTKVQEARNKEAKDRKEAERAAKNAIDAEKAFRSELEATNEAYGRRTTAMRFTIEHQAELRRELENTAGSHSKVDGAIERNIQSLLKFDKKKDDTRRNVQGFRKDIDDLSKTLGQFTHIDSTAKSFERLTSAIDTVRKISLGTLAGGGLLGAAGLLGGGGVEGITATIASLSELVGVVGLLPGALGAAGAAVGTLVVGFHGIQQSLAAMGNTAQFVQSLREIGPVTRQALITVQSFYSSFRGAMETVQDSLFAPIINDIRPLVYTYLPLLMHSGQQIAAVFGEAGHLFAQWLQTPQTISTIQSFLGNVAQGFQAALPAVQAFSQAFLTISSVGSGFFKELGASLAQVAQEFNSFTTNAAQTGQLQAFIQTGITALHTLLVNIKDVSEAFFNIFAIGNQYGGGFLSMFKNIGQEFLNWTRSARGIQEINNYFREITAAGQALHPILHTIGGALATVASTLVQLGTATAPGLQSFFGSLSSALHTLSPLLIQSAPAFNIFLTALGQLILNVVNQLGPNLPIFLSNFAQAATSLVGPATQLAGILGEMLSGLTPEDIKTIVGVTIAFESLGKIIPTVVGAMKLLNLLFIDNPIGLFIAALVLLAVNFDTVKGAISSAWETLSNWTNGLGELVPKIGQWFENIISNAYNWGKNLIQNFINGIGDMVGSVDEIVTKVAEAVERKLGIHSPAAEGPLSTDASVWGGNLASSFASGLDGGRSTVGLAATSIAGAASGGLSYSGAADPTGRGAQSGYGLSAPFGGGAGDGFINWIKAVTSDMSALSHIFREATQIFTNTASIGLRSLDVFARLWNGGVNPLTAPGGFDQGAKPLIPQQGFPGQSPVPGVPQASPSGALAPGAPGFIGPTVQPSVGQQSPPPAPNGGAGAPTGGSLPSGAAPSGLNQGQLTNAQMIIAGGRARGLNDDQIRAALAIASDESHITDLGTNFSGGNASVGGVSGIYQQSPGWHPAGAQHDINTFLDTFAANLAAQPGQDPLRVAVGIQQHGSPGAITPWQGTGGDQWYLGQVQNAQRNYPDYAAALGLLGQNGTGQTPANGLQRFAEELQRRQQAAGGAPTAGGSGAPVFGQIRPGSISGEAGLQPSARNIAGIVETLFPQIQRIGGVRPDNLPYHPSGHALDIAIPGWDTPEGQALGRQINEFLGANAQNLGIYDRIYQRQYYRTGEGPTPFQYTGSDPDQAHLTHIHVTTQGFPGSGEPEPSDFQRDITRLQGLPPGFNAPLGAGLGPNGGAGNLSATATATGGGPWWQGISPGIAAGGALGGSLLVGRAFQSLRAINAGIAEREALLNILRGGGAVGEAAEGVGASAGATGGIGLATSAGIVGAGVLGLYAGATRFGSATGQEDTRTPGVVYGPGGSVLSAGPLAPGFGLQSPAPVVNGGTGARPGQNVLNPQGGVVLQGGPGFPGVPVIPGNPTAVNPQGKPLDVNIQQQGGQPVPPATGAFAGRAGVSDIQAGIGKGAVGQAQATQANAPLVPAAGQPGSPTGKSGFPVPQFGQQLAGAGQGFGGQQGTAQGAPGGGVGGLGQEAVAGVGQGASPISAVSGMQVASAAIQGVANITSSVFQSIDSIIQSVEAFGDLVDTAAKIPKNSEQVIGMIKDVQQFITTGAQLAQTTSTILGTIGGLAGMGASGDPSGATAAVAGGFQAASMIAGLISDGLTTANAAISLGIDIYHEASKWGANLGGFTLGGPNTGWLGGNVQMLLNTNTGQLYTYSQDNPLNKNTLTPGFDQAYNHTFANQTPSIYNTNVYAGPGETTQQAFSNTMWAVNTSPEVISAAARK